MDLASYQTKHGLTLTELAERLTVKVPTLHGWISRRRRPSWDSLSKIEAATHGEVKAADFMPGTLSRPTVADLDREEARRANAEAKRLAKLRAST